MRASNCTWGHPCMCTSSSSSSFVFLYPLIGWFHEVTSFPCGSSGGEGPEPSEAGRGGHLAVNYWFHPPDNLDPSRKGYLRCGDLICVGRAE